MFKFIAGFIFLLSTLRLSAERINQEGRILGPLPVVTNSILFNTTNADAVVSAIQIFPVTNPWNEDISRRPLLVNSDTMITLINTNFAAANRSLIAEFEMNFVLAPDNQMLVSNQFVTYPDDSDLNGGTYPFGLYPIPTNLPVEKWPVGTGTQTLLQWQTNNDGSDRHSIIVQPGPGLIWETWMAQLTNGNWQAGNGAIFDLNTNALRMAGLTSGDAAGLPMFPALVRYDEAERGMVEHACRIVVKHSRKAYIYPATHDASVPSTTDTNVPAMGQRVRLKAAFVIPSGWAKEEKAVLLGLKKYGALVADNGSYFSISVTPDDRWPANCFNDLTSVAITNFEVIQTTGTNEGPRSPGAPVADAGPDETGPVGLPFQLQGAVLFTGTPPVISWKLYSDPGPVTFGDATLTNTTATFNAPGIYTLELSAADGVHAVAYDAVVITVTNGITVSIAFTGTNVNVSWTGGSPPYVVQQTDELAVAAWSDIVTTSVRNASISLTNTGGFFRVKGQ
jgi:hypothetical protein